MDYLECGEAIESGGVHRLGGNVGDVCDELLQIPTGLLQVGGVNDDLHQLRKGRWSFRHFRNLGRGRSCRCGAA